MTAAPATLVVPPGTAGDETARHEMDRRRRSAGRAARRYRLTVIVALALLFVAPFGVALASLSTPRWYPALELAETELHVRDAGSGRLPRTGLIGRLGTAEERGSHPGPLSFFALAPIYRLAGSSAWALQVATAAVHLAGVAAALWISHRRGGARLLLPVAVALAALLRCLGPQLLTEPWNPYLPLVWWVVFLLAVWSVVDDDPPLLPLAVIAGSLCAQTHVSYVGPVGGLVGLAVATTLVRAARRRHRRGARRPLAWLAGSAVLGAVAWLPPITDDTRGTGNLSLLVRYLTSSEEEPIGFGPATELLLANLDPWRLLVGRVVGRSLAEPPDWPVGGLLLVGLWLGSAVVAHRLRHRPLLRLHATLGVALALGVWSTSRIHGPTWQWLVLWTWGVTTLMVAAVAWTAGMVVDRLPERSRPARLLRPAAVVVLVVAALGSTVALTGDAADVTPDDTVSSRALAHLVPPVVEALERSAPVGPSGPAGSPGSSDSSGSSGDRYLVTWSDPVGILGELQGFGLLNELDREGIEVGVEHDKHLRAAPHLTMTRAEATGVVRLATGSAIDEWATNPNARLLVRYDPRSARQRARQADLRREIGEELRELGRTEVNDLFEFSFTWAYFRYRSDPELPVRLIAEMKEVMELGAPSAVFLEAP